MEYRLKIFEETFDVAADIEEDGILMSMGEENFKVSYQVISDHQIHLVIDGRGVNAYIADTVEGKLISIDGSTCMVVDADKLEQKGIKKSGAGGLPDKITPQTPSVVVSVLVGEGDEVLKGQGIITLSAMKMETTLGAPFNGRVKKINVTEGDKVMPGDILVEIEPSDDLNGAFNEGKPR